MAIFVWKESYCVGIKIIDDQHKVLVRIINELDLLLQSDFSVQQARALFGELLDYTKYHFATEERLMKIGGYKKSALDAHLKQHYQFIDEIHSLNNESIPVSADEAQLVMSYLTNWLKNHILKVDRQLANYLLRQEKPLPEGGPVFVPMDELEALYQSLGQAVMLLRQQYDSGQESSSRQDSASVIDCLNQARSLLQESTSLIEQASRNLSKSEEN
ncbi:hypothetical protein BTA51_16040 [Hahella sp. CCB-MM4]|uniref:bacteriohemerythrin n=1 Tax=Hahella sp. (strain CCB-MM4) TaxID=1926491 RepID=UPI000B9C2FA4|nr:bacteriohemerythrin [Hahella sp. CCB-MM4]OZG72251.1 hypothetical protein BTA51_16040 [Hahella sp. CCB-MM4]